MHSPDRRREILQPIPNVAGNLPGPINQAVIDPPGAANAARNEICRIGIKPPVFCKRDPDLYFIQMDSQFRNANITQDQTKYDYVVGSLDSSTLANIADIIRAPPANDKYQTIKARLISDFTDSENKKLRRLIQDCELGDNKPTQLLRQMRDLSGTSLNDDAIKAFWLQRLPDSVRAVVSIAQGDLNTCAKQADIMMEMGNFKSISSVHTQQPLQDLHSLKLQIDALQKQIGEYKKADQQQRGRSRTPARSDKQHGRTRSQSQVNKYPHCYYHHKFGKAAKNCVQPCKFNSEN